MNPRPKHFRWKLGKWRSEELVLDSPIVADSLKAAYDWAVSSKDGVACIRPQVAGLFLRQHAQEIHDGGNIELFFYNDRGHGCAVSSPLLRAYEQKGMTTDELANSYHYWQLRRQP